MHVRFRCSARCQESWSVGVFILPVGRSATDNFLVGFKDGRIGQIAGHGMVSLQLLVFCFSGLEGGIDFFGIRY